MGVILSKPACGRVEESLTTVEDRINSTKPLPQFSEVVFSLFFSIH